MKTLIEKLRDQFEIYKLKKHLKELHEMRASIHWSMQFDDLSISEIENNNRKLDVIELDKRITNGLLHSYIKN